MSFIMHKRGINMHILSSFIQIFYTWLLMQNSLFVHFKRNYSAPPMGMSNRLTVVLQQELH